MSISNNAEPTDCSIVHNISSPYLLYIGDITNPLKAKTGFGVVRWCGERVAGQLRFPACSVDLGVPDLSIDEAISAGAKSLVVGVAPRGGRLPHDWWFNVIEAAEKGMDVVSGLHQKLHDNAQLRAAADKSGARLVDLRTPPKNIAPGSGRRRRGMRILSVGTDCAVGKKYSALALTQSLKKVGADVTFRATGQTGIIIAGQGIAIDSVVADFISGAAELISPDNNSNHWDVIEGQGSLFHPSYAGVSLGLLHGSQPNAIVVCHDAKRSEIEGLSGYRLPSIAECVERNLIAGRTTNEDVICIGVCINTSGMEDDRRCSYLGELASELGLPCVDPMIDGCDAIVERLQSHLPKVFQ